MPTRTPIAPITIDTPSIANVQIAQITDALPVGSDVRFC